MGGVAEAVEAARAARTSTRPTCPVSDAGTTQVNEVVDTLRPGPIASTGRSTQLSSFAHTQRHRATSAVRAQRMRLPGSAARSSASYGGGEHLYRSASGVTPQRSASYSVVVSCTSIPAQLGPMNGSSPSCRGSEWHASGSPPPSIAS